MGFWEDLKNSLREDLAKTKGQSESDIANESKRKEASERKSKVTELSPQDSSGRLRMSPVWNAIRLTTGGPGDNPEADVIADYATRKLVGGYDGAGRKISPNADLNKLLLDPNSSGGLDLTKALSKLKSDPSILEGARESAKYHSFSAGARDAASFNFGDELTAKARSLPGDKNEAEELQKLRSYGKEAKDANPKTALAGDVTTSLLLPSGKFSKLSKLGQKAAKTLVSAGQGGLSGLGASEAEGTEATKDAILPAVIGGLIPNVVDATSSVFNKLAKSREGIVKFLSGLTEDQRNQIMSASPENLQDLLSGRTIAEKGGSSLAEGAKVGSEKLVKEGYPFISKKLADISKEKASLLGKMDPIREKALIESLVKSPYSKYTPSQELLNRVGGLSPDVRIPEASSIPEHLRPLNERTNKILENFLTERSLPGGRVSPKDIDSILRESITKGESNIGNMSAEAAKDAEAYYRSMGGQMSDLLKRNPDFAKTQFELSKLQDLDTLLQSAAGKKRLGLPSEAFGKSLEEAGEGASRVVPISTKSSVSAMKNPESPILSDAAEKLMKEGGPDILSSPRMYKMASDIYGDKEAAKAVATKGIGPFSKIFALRENLAAPFSANRLIAQRAAETGADIPISAGDKILQAIRKGSKATGTAASETANVLGKGNTSLMLGRGTGLYDPSQSPTTGVQKLLDLYNQEGSESYYDKLNKGKENKKEEEEWDWENMK